MVLEGKKALVTGGAGELGRVVARLFVREGAEVFITTRGPIPRGIYPVDVLRKIRPLRADVTDRRSVDALFRRLGRRGSPVQILVNTVGGFAATGPVSQTDPEEWDSLISTNLTSAFLCSRAFLRQKGMKGFGRIFNIAAQTVFRPSKGRAAYAVAKGGVAALTSLLGEEIKGSGITANAFAPSILDTRANRKSMPRADFSTWVDPQVLGEQILSLCRPSAGAVNGAVIPVFGGV